MGAFAVCARDRERAEKRTSASERRRRRVCMYTYTYIIYVSACRAIVNVCKHSPSRPLYDLYKRRRRRRRRAIYTVAFGLQYANLTTLLARVRGVMRGSLQIVRTSTMIYMYNICVCVCVCV